MPTDLKQTATALRFGGEPERREAASLLGRVSSEAKRDAARLNAAKRRTFGAKPKPIDDLPCTCGSPSPEPLEHRALCPRRRAARRRAKEAATAAPSPIVASV